MLPDPPLAQQQGKFPAQRIDIAFLRSPIDQVVGASTEVMSWSLATPAEINCMGML
jgi:hypothetical protein